MKKRKKVGMAELLWGKPPAIVPEWWEPDKKLDEEFHAIVDGLHAHERLPLMPDGVLREEAEWRLREMHEHALDILQGWYKRIAAHRKAFSGGQQGAAERHANERDVKQRRDHELVTLMADMLAKHYPDETIIDRAEGKISELETDADFNPRGVVLKLKQSTLAVKLRAVRKAMITLKIPPPGKHQKK